MAERYIQFEVYKQSRKDKTPRLSKCSQCGAVESNVFWKEWDNDDGWGKIWCHQCKVKHRNPVVF